MQMLSPQVPALVSYLGDQSLTEALLGALVDVSQASPSSLVSFLPALRIVEQQCPALLGHVAKIHGAVGIISEVQIHTNKLGIHLFESSSPDIFIPIPMLFKAKSGWTSPLLS